MTEQGRLLDAAAWNGRWFDGRWRAAAQTGAVIGKATGEELGRIGLATPADLAASARAATAAQVAWAQVAPDERAAIFRRAAQIVGRHRDELAGWIMRESGGLRVKADTELRSTLVTLHHAAAMMGEPHIPYGGRGASDNGSRIGGPANWDEFTQWQWITVREAPPPYPF